MFDLVWNEGVLVGYLYLEIEGQSCLMDNVNRDLMEKPMTKKSHEHTIFMVLSP